MGNSISGSEGTTVRGTGASVPAPVHELKGLEGVALASKFALPITSSRAGVSEVLPVL